MRSLAIVLSVLAGGAVVSPQRYQDFITTTPLAEGATLTIGFLGGRESWDNDKRGVRKLALKLRAMNRPGVHVETVENTRRPVALSLVRNAFDRDRSGRLDEWERASARVIVYGQSFGGAVRQEDRSVGSLVVQAPAAAGAHENGLRSRGLGLGGEDDPRRPRHGILT